MNCNACGVDNRAGAKFCDECGSLLQRRCASCQLDLRVGAKFCDECGSPVEVPRGEPQRIASQRIASQPIVTGVVAAVRKMVTVVFCDLGGSTGFGERTDPEVARATMARYHAILQEVVDAHGGTVAKFMGDGMMATFGVPVVAEDDATRAVRAGLEAQRRFAEFAAAVLARHREVLTFRVGVNTGEVVISSTDADLIGDALNVAARLEKACRPGRVLVGEETWRLTRTEFAYDPLGEVVVSGRTRPVSIFEVKDTASAVGEVTAPFVGREKEMRRVQAVFDSLVRDRDARLVSIIGSPGLGKTRLAREVCAQIKVHSSARTFEIHCDRAGNATFAPIAQLIRLATEIGDDSGAPEARTAARSLFADRDTDGDRLAEVLAGLVGAAPASSVEETFWAVRRMVESVALTQPVIVVVDDIQWAEPLLLDLLEHLVEWLRDASVLMVTLARPELRETRPELVQVGRRVADVIALDGLDAGATEKLAAGLLGADRLPAGLIGRLPASTDGNPLFVRELIRMLVADRIIHQTEGVWELTIDPEALEVPPTIQSLLAARVERLPNEERELLELASVIGPEFSLGALKELAGTSGAETVVARLERMRRKELVEPTGTYWGDEPIHRFHHLLIRDATYRRLLKATRADLHTRVAKWTDRRVVDLIGENEAVVAYHYEQAVLYRRELDDVDASTEDLGRRAAALLGIAAARALDRDDLGSAGSMARRALGLLSNDDDGRVELLRIACESLLSSGDVVAGRELVRELAGAAVDDPTARPWAACFEAQLIGLTDPDRLLEADALATTTAAEMQHIGDRAGEAKAHQVRAGLLARLGRIAEAELELDLALGAARSVNDRRRVTAVLGAAPVAALWGPSPVARAGGRCLDVVRLLRITTASPSVEATSMRCQAVLEALRGRFDIARSMLASARSTLEELGLRHGLMETELLAGVVELIAGEPAAALAPLRVAYHGLDALGVGADAGQAAALLAQTLLVLRQFDEADAMATASELLAGQNLKTAIAWRTARAEVLAASGDVDRALTFATTAVDIAATTDLVVDHADACAALARVHALAGDTVRAQMVLAEAIRLYEQKGATAPVGRLARAATSVGAADEVVSKVGDGTLPALPQVGFVPANDTVRIVRQFWQYTLEGRVDDAAELMIEDFVHEDRRSLMANEIKGRDATMRGNQVVVDLGFTEITLEPIRTVGERAALVRWIARTAAGDEIVNLQVLTTNDLGRRTGLVSFNHDDLATALVEFDARCARMTEPGPSTSRGTPTTLLFAPMTSVREDVPSPPGQLSPLDRTRLLENAVTRLFLASSEGHWIQDGRWDLVAELYHPEIVVVDKRRGVSAPTTHGRDAFLASVRPLADFGVRSFSSEWLDVRGDHLALSRLTFVTEQDFEVHALNINEADESGRIARVVLFDDNDLERALGEMNRLFEQRGNESPGRGATMANDVVRAFQRGYEMAQGSDWAGVAALVAENMVLHDRRQGVTFPELHGRRAFTEFLAATLSVFGGVSIEPIETRGQRLALFRLRVASTDGFEVITWSVWELDGTGLMARNVVFDESDFRRAVAELDDRESLIGTDEP